MDTQKQTHLVQFLPYFTPHIGGVEKVGEDIFLKWTYGKSFILSGNICQQSDVYKKKVDNNMIYLFPCFEIVDNFIFPSILTQKFWKVWKEFSQDIKNSNKNGEIKILTHTRFFLSSFMGGIFARKYKYDWIHLEHGSDYVKLSSPFKNKIAYLYDRLIGKWIFKNADRVLTISGACKNFTEKEFGREDAKVWYRGVSISKIENIKGEDLHKKFLGKKIIGYIGRLYKWKNVNTLIEAYYNLDDSIQKETQLVIVGNGEDFTRLKHLDRENRVYFTGEKGFKQALALQKQFDIHMHPSSPGGGLATTLLQAMYFGCFIVATPYEGAKEVIKNNVNGILLKDDSEHELQRGMEQAYNNIGKYNKQYAERNLKFIEEKCDMEKNIETLYNLIK